MAYEENGMESDKDYEGIMKLLNVSYYSKT